MADFSNWGYTRFHFDEYDFEHPMSFGPFQIMQFGDLSSQEGYCCPDHKQSVHEITYCVNGRSVFTCGGKAYAVGKGDVIVNPKDTHHTIQCAFGERIRYYYVGFIIADTSRPEYAALEEWITHVTPGAAKGDQVLADAFSDLFVNFINRDAFSEEMVTAALYRLLVWTKRIFDGMTKRLYSTEVRPPKGRLLSELTTYLESHAEDINVLKTLPEQFGYSYSYLSGLFAKANGRSMQSLVNEKRLESAFRLLNEGVPVTEAAEKLGYASIHPFSHWFTRVTGVSPHAYQKNINTKQKESKS